MIEKDSVLDHLTGGIFNGRPYVCFIEEKGNPGIACGKPGYVVYPFGILCREA
jgi:hypothetical protein